MNRVEHIEDNKFYHVYNRGNDRQAIFDDESDYCVFLTKMDLLSHKHDVEVPVYTLMPNHYHFIHQQRADGNVSNIMGALGTATAKRINLKYGHIGHLFQGPFQYKIVPEDVLWHVACCVHLNPVRAGLVKMPGEWRFSNYASFEEGFLPQKKNREEGNLLRG